MKKLVTPLFLFIVILLSGCLFPSSELSQNEIPNEEQLKMVEKAVLQYKEQTNGLMPIKTKESDVARYEKYLIDFTLLKEAQLIQETPGTAYENGGYYQYILLDPEEDVQVKLIDLRITEKIREVNVKLDMYRQKNIYPPFGEEISKDIYRLNYEKLGYKSDPTVISPFTKEDLPILITTDGSLIVDYRVDLQRAIAEFNPDIGEGDDLRNILEKHYPFVPAYSVKYELKDDEPSFSNPLEK